MTKKYIYAYIFYYSCIFLEHDARFVRVTYVMLILIFFLLGNQFFVESIFFFFWDPSPLKSLLIPRLFSRRRWNSNMMRNPSRKIDFWNVIIFTIIIIIAHREHRFDAITLLKGEPNVGNVHAHVSNYRPDNCICENNYIPLTPRALHNILFCFANVRQFYIENTRVTLSYLCDTPCL